MDFLANIADEIWGLVNEMSPYLLLGFLLAGLMHVFVPNTLYSRYLSGNNMRSVINAALFGIPLPLCSCGVIPTAMGLRREGASKGSTVSFLIATPQTGVDSIIATYSLMGLPFAIIRPIAALVTAVFGGFLTNAAEKEEPVSSATAKRSVKKEVEHHSFGHKLVEAVQYAFIEMMEDIGKWLVIGLLIAGIITAVVPDEWFAVFQDNSLYSILFVMLFSIPMYLCATGSIPIAVALMLKGLTPGAALVLLMAGPASNAASILVIRKVMGKRTLITYLISIISGAILFGLGIDYLLPREWFTDALQVTKSCCESGPGWFSQLCTWFMIALLINALYLKIGGHEHHHCHCGCEDEDHCEVKTYTIDGMHCNHCAANTEKAIASVHGVESVHVDLDSKTATVEGEFDEAEMRRAVESIGFSVQ